MVLFPEVQAKAHTLIDTVIGASRLPTFSDRPSLQYIDAILRETLRWHPVLPLCTYMFLGAHPFLTEFCSNAACIGEQRCLRGILYTQRHQNSCFLLKISVNLVNRCYRYAERVASLHLQEIVKRLTAL
jgi:hypothetical protein